MSSGSSSGSGLVRTGGAAGAGGDGPPKRRRTEGPGQDLPTQVPENGFSTEAILRVVQEIRRLPGNKKQKMDLVAERYPQFVVNHPRLYHMACSDDFDMERFRYMLRLRDSIRNQEQTLDDVSTRLGQELFDIYVKDKVAHLGPGPGGP